MPVAGAFAIGCQNGVTGPSLSATVQNVRLNPTVAGVQGGENVCCCHVIGSVTNTSSITVSATIEPQVGTEGGTPNPRKLSPASLKIA